jgi:hypothetical protein
MLLHLSSTTFFSAVFLLVSSGSVYGWGFDGHALVARIAQTLLTDESTTFVLDHLPSDVSGDMSKVASWLIRFFILIRILIISIGNGQNHYIMLIQKIGRVSMIDRVNVVGIVDDNVLMEPSKIIHED